MSRNQVLSHSGGLDSLPPAERAHVCWAEYERLLGTLEYSPLDRRTRDELDACVLQYVRAVADVARSDQDARRSREVGELAGEEWEEYLGMTDAPGTCDSVVGSGGETTKDAADPRRCGRRAAFRSRRGATACDFHVTWELQEQLRKVRALWARVEEGGDPK